MKRLLIVTLIVSGLMALLAACGELSTAEGEATETPELDMIEAELNVCAEGCPAGFAVSQYYCGGVLLPDGRCTVGECTDPNIRDITSCTDIPDGNDLDPADSRTDTALGAFEACGTTPNPTPYHYPHSYQVNSGCTPNLYTWDSTKANRTLYHPYPGPDQIYTSCGMNSCRSGDYTLSYSYSTSCRLSTLGSNSAKNRKTCQQIVAASAHVCGIVSCPSSKHYVSAYTSTSDCSETGDVPIERNRTICLNPSSTTTSLYACGSSCPDGFVAQSYSYSDSCRPLSSSSTNENNRVYCVRSGG